MTEDNNPRNRTDEAAPNSAAKALLWSAIVAVSLSLWTAVFEVWGSWPAGLWGPSGDVGLTKRLHAAAALMDPQAGRQALWATAAVGALLWALAAIVTILPAPRSAKLKERPGYWPVLFTITCLVLFIGWFHVRALWGEGLSKYMVYAIAAAAYLAFQFRRYVRNQPPKHPLNTLFWQAAWMVAALSLVSSLSEHADHLAATSRYLLYVFAVLICAALYYLCRKAGEKILDDDAWRRTFQASGAVAGLVLLIIAAAGSSPRFQEQAPYPSLRGTPAQGPNLVFIVLDTVRADRLSLYGHKRYTTPFLKSVAEGGALWKRAYTPSPWTLPSHASMFTGLYPSAHQCVHGNLWLDERFETLAEKLSDKGYVNLAFSANPWISDYTNLDQGFHELVHPRVLFHEKPATWGEEAGLIIKALAGEKGPRDSGATEAVAVSKTWLQKSKRNGRPFFLFINLMEAHLPYPKDPSAYYFFMDAEKARRDIDAINFNWLAYDAGLRDLTASEKEKLRTWYDGSIHYLDLKLEELFRELRVQGLYEDTLTVVVSDHGENIGHHGLWGHEFSMYHGLLHVPVVVSFPGRVPEGTTVDGPYSLERLFPLILSLLEGGEFPEFDEGAEEDKFLYAYRNRPYRFMERVRSYFPDYDTSYFDSDQRSVIDWPYHFIWDSGGDHELYDLEKDPHEENNILRSKPGLGDKYKSKIMEFAEAHPPLYPESQVPAYDAAAEQRLRSLGYIK